MPNKEWYPERFADVSRRLMKEHRVVQVGSACDPPLPCHLDCRGKTSLEQTTALLSVASLFIGQVGFLMHLARAVDCPAVIVYGGREAPQLTGYDCNVNLFTDMHCSPCWRHWTCEYDRKCMAEIMVDHVIEGVRTQLHKGRSLPVAETTL
jgi:ADP-heptose:LPS heptosyltransferase